MHGQHDGHCNVATCENILHDVKPAPAPLVGVSKVASVYVQLDMMQAKQSSLLSALVILLF
eukprot:COSAG02_NODE_229_length_28128_cov_18.529131_6_plen_61_part_00